ncbi:Trp biosynthesis-associated membrane protein [Actinophytocola sediminis]
MADRRPQWIVWPLLLAAAVAFLASTGLADGPDSGGGLALVALAGAGGTIAASGWARRVVGALVVLAGLLAGWQALAASGGGLGRWVALLGALSLVAAGSLVIRFTARLPTLGARYRSANARTVSSDPDKDMWDGLSDGRDPTMGKAENEH